MAGFAGQQFVDALPWVVLPILVGGALRGQDREVGIAQSRALQLAKSDVFDNYDQMMAYQRMNNTPIARNYSGTNALDWLKSAGVVGLGLTTGNPAIAMASGAWAYDRQMEKAHRANEFRRIFEENV